MKRILLCPSLNRDVGLEITKKVYAAVRSRGIEAVVCPFGDEETSDLPEGLRYAAFEDVTDGADLAVCFGGDGTILRTARAVSISGVPILPINMGTKGFMAEIEPEDIHLVDEVISGGMKTVKRMMLDVSLERDGQTVYEDFALNDVVVGGIAKVIDLELFGDGSEILEFSGDGAVVSTPSGSTAYSMAAGGPIVEPDAQNIIVTPICAHILAAKSFVLAPERHVSIVIGSQRKNPVYMSVDGGASVDLFGGDTVHVERSQYETKLVQLSNKSFYSKVHEILGEKR